MSANPTSPGPQYSDILDLTAKMQMDIRELNAKLTTLRSWIAAQPDQQRSYDHVCPHDQLTFRTDERLTEHLANVHGERSRVTFAAS